MSFGRLERRSTAQPMSEINVTPLVDVMLVLMVIFMLTAPLLVSAVKLDLPQSGGESTAPTPQSVSVSINKLGQVFFNDKAIPLPELASTLSAVAQANPATELQLRADAAVPYGRVVEVMDIAQRIGLNRIGFVTEAPATPAP